MGSLTASGLQLCWGGVDNRGMSGRVSSANVVSQNGKWGCSSNSSKNGFASMYGQRKNVCCKFSSVDMDRADSILNSVVIPTPTPTPTNLADSDELHDLNKPTVASSTLTGKLDSGNRMSLSSLMTAVADDLQILNNNLQAVVGAENPMLTSAAEQIFSAGGKRMRPALVFLVSRATAQMAGLKDVTPQHRRLAEIIEMIHTASLIHDDVLDESDVRRGKKTIHQLYGTRIAVLAGDFLFAQSSWYLANLENLEVIKLISQVIKDFANGEIKQASSLFDCDISLQDYLDKSFYKTASLIAASTRSAAIFSGVNSSVCDQMYNYGMNLGLAFQVVDDILDFTQSTAQLGKPAASDLVKGNLTAPVLFALEQEPKLREIIDSEFTEEGSLDIAIDLVHRGGGIERSQSLAKQKGDLAIKNLQCLPSGAMRSSLEGMIKYVLQRID